MNPAATELIALVYAMAGLTILTLLAGAVFIAEPASSRSAKGGVALLAAPTAFLGFIMFFEVGSRIGKSAQSGIWPHALTFFSWYAGPLPIYRPTFGAAFTAALTGLVIVALFGGAVLMYVAVRNPTGRARVMQALAVAASAMIVVGRNPRSASSVLARLFVGAGIVAAVGVGMYLTTPWDSVSTWARQQVRPVWLFEGTPIRVRPTGVAASVSLEGGWQRLVLPDCPGTFKIEPTATVGVQLPDRRRMVVHAVEPVRLPAVPRWVRGTGEVRMTFVCRR